jgi:GNAT superfamily N-acetyltransferase
MKISVRQATVADVDVVATLVHLLLVEITSEDETPPAVERVHTATKALLADDTSVWAFLAESDAGEAIGVLTLNECASIYAGGRFGEISELYVTPGSRSKGVGPKLLAAAKEFGNRMGWRRLEVGAPDVPKWKRTAAFYRRNGFDEVGPRLRILL